MPDAPGHQRQVPALEPDRLVAVDLDERAAVRDDVEAQGVGDLRHRHGARARGHRPRVERPSHAHAIEGLRERVLSRSHGIAMLIAAPDDRSRNRYF